MWRDNVGRMAIVFGVLLMLLAPAYAQEGYRLPQSLQVITPENAAQLTPLAQLGSATPGGIYWSPNGNTLLAGTSNGTYRYRLPELETPEFFEGLGYIQYNATGTYAVTNGKLLDGETFEVLETGQHYRFIEDGTVLVTTETTDAGVVQHLADAETLVEFAALPTAGWVDFSSDRRFAITTSGGGYVDESGEYIPHRVELWNVETETLLTVVEHNNDIPIGPIFTDRWLILGSIDSEEFIPGSIHVLDLETGERVRSWNTFYMPSVSPDGRWMLLTAYSYAVLVSLDDFLLWS